MAKLFRRSASLVIQDRKVRGLDFEFRIERSLKPDQNTAEITVYNLSEDTRKHIQDLAAKTGSTPVELHAGYAANALSGAAEDALSGIGLAGADSELPLVYKGQLRSLNIQREGSDWILHLTSGDGDESRKRRIDFSLGPGASLKSAIDKALGELAIGIGNAPQALGLGGLFGPLSQQFTHGTTLSGNAQDELVRLLKSAGKEFSIQNGEAQILDAGKPLNTLAVILTEKTGLVGSPEIGEKNTIRFRSLLNPEIYPGRRLAVESEQTRGFFRCERATYLGQTAGGDWYVDGEGTAIGLG